MRQPPTFGQALGELIRQKRKAAGLTQMQLAEDAFHSAGKTRRISELETGLVANPHAKTIDPIIQILKISDAEIEACAKSAAERPDQDLDRAYREARNLIDAVARQFEHSNPNASLAELDDFLREKAREWSSLKARIDNIASFETELSGLRQAAGAALAEGRFDEVDQLLASAEDNYQLQRTLKEVEKHAEIRVARGDNSILKGDDETALKFYLSAAESYRPFDPEKTAETIERIAERIYETARRSLRQPFLVAGGLLEALLELENVKARREITGTASYRLGLIYRSQYEVAREGANAAAILDKAISHATSAVELLGGSDDPLRAASVRISLANCLNDRARRESTLQDSIEARAVVTEAIEILSADVADENALLAHAYNNLGSFLMTSLEIGKKSEELPMILEASEAFSLAISKSEELSYPDTWSAGKSNLGMLLARRASTDASLTAHQRQFLRTRAISELAAAKEAFPLTAFAVRLGEIAIAIGDVLVDYSDDLSDAELKEVYLGRAIQSYQSAVPIFDRDEHPKKWARLQQSAARVLIRHSQLEGVETAPHDLGQAIDCLDDAISVFDAIGAAEHADVCRQNRSVAERLLQAIT